MDSFEIFCRGCCSEYPLTVLNRPAEGNVFFFPVGNSFVEHFGINIEKLEELFRGSPVGR
ncbi:MAG: hypothetical protein HGB33_10250 [Syntrophaceae bacterium]|nr:hypothetical protein [Syntrophaceae bacterium]